MQIFSQITGKLHKNMCSTIATHENKNEKTFEIVK